MRYSIVPHVFNRKNRLSCYSQKRDEHSFATQPKSEGGKMNSVITQTRCWVSKATDSWVNIDFRPCKEQKNERVEKLEQNPQTNFWGNPQIDVHAKNELLKLMLKNFCNRNNTFWTLRQSNKMEDFQTQNCVGILPKQKPWRFKEKSQRNVLLSFVSKKSNKFVSRSRRTILNTAFESWDSVDF